MYPFKFDFCETTAPFNLISISLNNAALKHATGAISSLSAMSVKSAFLIDTVISIHKRGEVNKYVLFGILKDIGDPFSYVVVGYMV